MTALYKETIDELSTAMDTYKIIANKLIGKLISETKQPEIKEIIKGQYYLIENSELINGKKHLSDSWDFDVHGEHCLFVNLVTGQRLEVSLGNKESLGNLDPYFFYDFLKTTESLKHLADNFKNPFNDMCAFFEHLIEQKVRTYEYFWC
ncbi:UNVERIFIED_CONTAM: hypothetical protein Cloal_1697 [Acetivibrio alkalicellulosi]